MRQMVDRWRARAIGVGLFVGVLAMGVPATAQTGGIITGAISDPQGGVLPGVTVTLRNTETGVTRTAVTEADGRYRFAALAPGPYALKAELQGFAATDVRDLTLTIGLELRHDITMALQGVQETLTVTGQAPVIETTKSEVAGVVTQAQIETLPINSRQTLELSLLMPGVSNDATRPRKVNTNVGAGGTFFSSAYLVDGASNQEVIAGEPRQDFPQGAIREFKVNVSQAAAEFGGTTGGVVTIVTRSGTNSLSGEAFEYFRDKSLNAMNKFEKLNRDTLGYPKPDFRRHQFGASLGGPIRRDRMHYFVASDLTETDEFITVNTLKPQFYSAVEGTFKNPRFRRMFFSRWDSQLAPQQSLFARWGYERDHNTCEGCGGNIASFANNTVEQRRHSLVAGHTWIVSSRMLNEFRFQLAPFIFLLFPPGSPAWTNVGEFPQERFDPTTFVYNFPSLTWGSGSSRVQRETWWEFRDDFSVTTDWHGSHAWKFGAASVNGPDTDDLAGNTKGTWTFNTDQPFNPDDRVSIASLRNPTLFTATFPPVFQDVPNRWFTAFLQDDWHPASNLTLNLGVRYDLQTGVFNEDLDPNAFGRPIPYIDPKSRGDNNNVQPRAGFAWDMKNNGRSVLRGGYGLYNRYLWSLYASERQLLSQNNVIIRNPSYPDPYQEQSPSRFVSTAPPNISTVANDLENPIAHGFNLGLSQGLTTDLALHADAVYTRTTREPTAINVNTPDPGTRMRKLPEWGQINETQSVGRAKYRALFLRLDKRLSHRHQYLISYTLAKSDDNLPFGGLAASTSATDANNPALDDGPSRGDRRHSLVASGAVQLPGDLTVGAVWTLRSTMAFSARAQVDLNGDGALTDFVPGTSRNQWNRGHNADLLIRVNAWRGQNNRAPIQESQIDTNPVNSFDMRVSRAFRLSPTQKVEVIAQVFNVFGVDNLLPPASAAGWVENSLSDSFGRILTANNRQQAELAIRFVW
jgi:outer membrane receptor protein involved in Fe transport